MWMSAPTENWRSAPPPASDPPDDWDWLTQIGWGTSTWADVPDALREAYAEPESLDLYQVVCKRCDLAGETRGKGLQFVAARGGGHVRIDVRLVYTDSPVLSSLLP